MATIERNLRKERVGKVVSDKMDKSITVAVERKVKHPINLWFMTRTMSVTRVTW
jgi:small subunit ribosomal protein S17